MTIFNKHSLAKSLVSVYYVSALNEQRGRRRDRVKGQTDNFRRNSINLLHKLFNSFSITHNGNYFTHAN